MEFLILGSLEVRTASGAVGIGGERERKLLAILLLNANLVVPVEQLVDELWSAPPATARRQIYNVAATVRRRLVAAGFPASIIATTAGGYRISTAGASLDADLARRRIADANRATADGRHDEAIRLLTTVAALWRGQTLAGLRTPMIESVAARLDEQRVAVLEKLAELRLAAGEGATLVSDLMEHVARYPLRESLRGTLMLALLHSGRQAEALAVFEEGRHRLAEELGLDPGPELRRIHAAVLRGSPQLVEALIDEPAGDVRVAGGTPTSFLPPQLTDFVGREHEMAEALDAVQAGRDTGLPGVLVIHGMGGVGKTSFAIRLAHHLAPHYPDGQYFIDLRGFSANQRPVTQSGAMAILLGQVGIPVGLGRPEVSAGAAQLRAAFTDRRVLMVLDNAADADFVQQLLPGTAGSLVVVTSRRQLVTLDGAHPLNLHPLPPGDALTLFASVCGYRRAREEPEASNQIIQMCGYLPFAVRAAASRLRHRPLWSVADLAEQLRNPFGRLQLLGAHERSIAEVLRVSYGRLAPAHQRLFRVLGRHTGPYLSARGCAVIANVSLAAAEQGLEALADCSLVTPEDRHRYQLHPLLRDLATELATHGEAA